MTEESASMNSLCGTTTGKNTFKEVEKTLVQYNLKWGLLRCVTTDGGKKCVWRRKTLSCTNLQSL